jgi:hypothetical protein
MKRPAVHLLRGVLLLLVVGCSMGESQRAQAPAPSGESVENQVKAIQAEAKRIDAASASPDTAERHRQLKEFSHWQFSGLFEHSNAVLLKALFTEGQLARAETCYLRDGKPVLVKVARWWDVADEKKAPEPRTTHEFYIAGDQIIRHVTKVASSPPVDKTEDTARPAAGLAERSRAIAQILGGGKDAALRESLKAFPEVDPPEP